MTVDHAQVRDSRGVYIEKGDVVALATPGYIKRGKVIGFRTQRSRNVYANDSRVAVVVECVGGSAPSVVQYPESNLLVLSQYIRDDVNKEYEDYADEHYKR